MVWWKIPYWWNDDVRLVKFMFCIEKFEKIYIIFPVFCTNPINRNDSQKVNLKHPFVQSNQQKLYICLNANKKNFQRHDEKYSI